MANTSISNPAAAFSEAARFGEIRSRFFFLIGALVVYRIGTFIPVPGVNPAEVARFFGDRSNTILGIVNMFSGGALSRLSIFAMGDRKSTRLNSSHSQISYAVFCLKKKK